MAKHLRLNMVHNDEIWKDHVRREMQSFTKKWPEKWGFLTDEYKMMNCELTGKSFPATPDTKKKEGNDNLKLPDINQTQNTVQTQRPKSPFPVTTASLIGWKSTKDPWQLEKYGRYAPSSRGQIGILKLFNWPQQGI